MASVDKSDYFLYVVAYLTSNGNIQIYRAYSYAAEAKKAAGDLWRDHLKVAKEVYGEPVVAVATPQEQQRVLQAMMSLSSSVERYTGGEGGYVPQQVVVEKVFMDSKDGDRLRKCEPKGPTGLETPKEV